MQTRLFLSLFAVFLLTVCAEPAHAQRTSGSIGVGGQLGDPSGLTLKVYNEQKPSYDFLAAWSLRGNTSFFLNGHAQWSRDLNPEGLDQDLEWFVGPGAFLLVEDNDGPGDDDEAVFGVSGTIGLNLVLNRRVELYVQATPRLALAPDTDGDIGGGLGFRYYF